MEQRFKTILLPCPALPSTLMCMLLKSSTIAVFQVPRALTSRSPTPPLFLSLFLFLSWFWFSFAHFTRYSALTVWGCESARVRESEYLSGGLCDSAAAFSVICSFPLPRAPTIAN